MTDQVLINAVIPLLFTYGRYQQDHACRDRALQWMECLPAENNTITKGFMKAGVRNDNAHDSQALLQLKKNYCDNRRCLDCAIGNKLLKS